MNGEEIAGAIIAATAVMGSLGYIGKRVRGLVHTFDKVEKLLGDTAETVDRELTKNSGTSIKDQVGNLAEFTQIIASEMADHGEKSRAAMAIYRKALADQGIHLPVAPGEDGYGDA